MPTLASPRFYVYILCRPDGTPFYVGKGSGTRVHNHEREARLGHRCKKCHTIRKIWRNGGQVQRFIVFSTDSEEEAFTHEIETIALFGRGTLCNQTDGGEGQSGGKHTAAIRAKLSASQRARYAKPEERAKISKASVAAWGSSEYRAKQLTSHRDTPWGDPEQHAQMSTEATRKRWSMPGERVKQSAKSKERWSDPDFRSKAIAAMKQASSTPEEQARKSAASKAPRRPPSAETRAKISQTLKAKAEQRRVQQSEVICPPEETGNSQSSLEGA